MRHISLTLFWLFAWCGPGVAQTEVSVFGAGADFAPGIGKRAALGASPISHMGMRVTWWQTPKDGLAFQIEKSTGGHAPSDEVPMPGQTAMSLQALRRWESPVEAISPYIAAGLSLSFRGSKHSNSPASETTSGFVAPNLVWAVGASLAVSESVSLFGEIKTGYHLDGLFTEFHAAPINNSFDMGVSFGF